VAGDSGRPLFKIQPDRLVDDSAKLFEHGALVIAMTAAEQ